MGVTHEKTAIAYSDGANLDTSQLWHVLAHHLHDRVAPLHGGIETWQAENRPLDRGTR